MAGRELNSAHCESVRSTSVRSTGATVTAGSSPGEPPPGVEAAVLIEGGFTHDALPDLFRYLCTRGESLWWELKTLAGTFVLVFERGLPSDVMFSPARPVGAKVGLNALRILFRQEGGRFTVRRGAPVQQRRSLTLSGEQLLIEMATLDDEAVAPAVLSGRTVDVSAELALVGDLAPQDHRTAFRTWSLDVPLTDVLQLFSVSRLAYWIHLLGEREQLIGRLLLSANEVCQAEYGALRGGAAFTALLGHAAPGIIDVSPLRATSSVDEAVGKLDALLMRELLSGRLNVQTGGQVGGTPESILSSLDGSLARLEHGEASEGSPPPQHQPDTGPLPAEEGTPLLKRVRNWFGRVRA